MAKLSYLEKLRFDPKLLQSATSKYLTNYRYVLLLILSIIAMGTFSFRQLPRRLNPEVKISIVSVSTVFPGANPQDIESLVTAPIEDEISGLEGIDKINSSSAENISLVTVQFRDGFDPDKAKDNVQSAVDSTTLPENAQNPKVAKLDFENQPVWQFLITPKGNDPSLHAFSQKLKEEIERLPSVKEVVLTGRQIEEVQILVSKSMLANYNIDAAALSQTIQSSLSSHPAGNIVSENLQFNLTIDPKITTLDDIRNLNLNLNGQIIKLGDIAIVSLRSKPDQNKTFMVSNSSPPQRTIGFSVFKVDSANINAAVADTRKVVKDKLDANPQFQLFSILDLGKLVDRQFTELGASFRDTIILVIAILLVFLGIRQALIVAFSIPLSFLVAFTIMRIFGLTLNFLSLFSLILALALLVDDAIVIVTAVTVYWRTRKFTPNQTGLLVLRDFFVPIWSTTITAVWAFLPILIAAGIIGQFIKSISIVVSTTLIASTAIAILITLPTMMIFLKPQLPRRVKILFLFIIFAIALTVVLLVSFKTKLLAANVVATIALFAITIYLRDQIIKSFAQTFTKYELPKKIGASVGRVATHGLVDSEKFARQYQRLINRILATRSAQIKTLVIISAFAIFAYALGPARLVQYEFFPKVDSEVIFINVELPPGTNLDKTTDVALKILDEVKTTPDSDFALAETGKTVSTSDFFQNQGSSNNVLVTVVLPQKEKRKQASYDIAANLRNKLQNFEEGKLSVIEQSGGPPVGADVNIKILGEDLATLDEIATQVEDYLKTRPGLTNITKSPQAGTSKITFVPDETKLTDALISQDALSFQLRTYASGFTLDSDVKLEGNKKDIVFRTSDEIENPQNLEALAIKGPKGQLPLAALGEFKIKPNPTRINREDGQHTISVSASTTKATSTTVENTKLLDFAKTLKLPPGFETKFGGVNEENQKSVNSILEAMVIALILIAATMVIQFGSYRKAAIVLLLIPVAISGVFVVFALTGTSITFPTLIGILALFGIVVYQSMLIVDKIGKNIIFGMDLKHAISDACASRVEPIMFGTITTVIGLTPITLSNPLWRGLGGAIIAGMLFSGIIMLLFIPVVYYLTFRKEVK